MQFYIKKLPKSEVEITIEVPTENLASARQQAISQLSQEVKIEGFRPGKIPEDILIKKVGETTVEHTALDIAVKFFYAEVVKKEKIKVIAAPEIKIKTMSPLKFIAKVTVLPDVKIGDYLKIKLQKTEIKVSPAEIEKVVADIKKGNPLTKTVTNRTAAKKDRVEIDFAGTTLDGVPLDGTVSKNHPLVLGENTFIPGFEEGIIGMNIEEEKDHIVKFPADYHAKHLANTDVKFKIKLHKIEELNEPTLDDEFAKKVSGGQKSKWKEVEDDIANFLKKQKESEATQKLEDNLVAELLKISKVDVPSPLIITEEEFLLNDIKKRLSGGGMTWEKYLEQTKKTEEDIKKDMSVEAEKRVKARLVLSKLVEIEKVEVDNKEIIAEIEHIKTNHPAESEKNKIDTAYSIGSANRERLQHQLKVIKLLKELTKKFTS